MSYSIEVVRRTDQYTANWSGGTTTQIAIYPPQARYEQRNFTWRLSSAKVVCEESTFTLLPGMSRVLMVVDGVIKLAHQDHHSIELQPFEQDRFSGDWPTKSFGKVRDFNLMMSQECKGNLTVIPLDDKAGSEVSVVTSRADERYTAAFYCVDGSVNFVVAGTNSYELQEGDLLLLNREQQNGKIILKINNLAEKAVTVIRADLQY